MAGVEEPHLRIVIVALERFRSAREEERIVSAPCREQRWLMDAKVLLELRVQGDIAGVVKEQIELNLIVAGPSKKGGVERIGFRGDERFICHAVDILPFRGLRLQELAQRGTIRLDRLLPI